MLWLPNNCKDVQCIQNRSLYISKMLQKITVNIDGVIPQQEKNGNEKYRQEYFKVPFDENETNKSIEKSEQNS